MSSPHRRPVSTATRGAARMDPTSAFWLGSQTLCERCGLVRDRSVTDSQLCTTCNPDPRVAAALAREVDQRLEEARQRAADILEPPDREHVWLFQPSWGFAHLFAAGERDAYCGHARIAEPVRPWLQKGAWAGIPPCGFCRHNHAAAMGERVEVW